MKKITKYRSCIPYYNQRLEDMEWKSCSIIPGYMKIFAQDVAKSAIREIEQNLGEYDVGLDRARVKAIVQFDNGHEIWVSISRDPVK